MQNSWNVLVACARLENRRALIRILDGLPVNVITSGTLRQAQEVLAGQEIQIVFCDASLPDGSYRDLLSMPTIAKPRVVVTTQTWEPQDYQEATEQGVFGVLRCPLEPTDVELIVIRAAHDRRQWEEHRMSA